MGLLTKKLPGAPPTQLLPAPIFQVTMGLALPLVQVQSLPLAHPVHPTLLTATHVFVDLIVSQFVPTTFVEQLQLPHQQLLQPPHLQPLQLPLVQQQQLRPPQLQPPQLVLHPLVQIQGQPVSFHSPSPAPLMFHVLNGSTEEKTKEKNGAVQRLTVRVFMSTERATTVFAAPNAALTMCRLQRFLRV